MEIERIKLSRLLEKAGKLLQKGKLNQAYDLYWFINSNSQDKIVTDLHWLAKVGIIESRILIGENLREKKKVKDANNRFILAMHTAAFMKLWILYAWALQQRIISWKHWYQNAPKEDKAFKQEQLRKMEEDIEEGLKLRIPDEHKAGFFLRKGDVEYFRGDFIAMLKYYSIAVEMLFKRGFRTHTLAEFMGHKAEALSLNGKYQEAVDLVKEAFKILANDKRIRRWHRLIIKSGLHGRVIKAGRVLGKWTLVIKSAIISLFQALILAIWYRMPQRLKQYFQKLFGKY